jgi:hypothetical protein
LLSALQLRTINDTVMGGRSSSECRVTPQGELLFSGRLVLEGGGFVSVRGELPSSVRVPSSSSGLAVSVRGDGARYKLQVRTAANPMVSWQVPPLRCSPHSSS